MTSDQSARLARLCQVLDRWTWLIHPVVALSFIAVVLLTGYRLGYQTAVDGGRLGVQQTCQQQPVISTDQARSEK